MKSFNRIFPAATATALGLVLAITGQSAYAANTELPEDVLARLERLTKRVEQLEAELQKKQEPAYQQASSYSDLQQKVLVLERKQELAEEEQLKQKQSAPVVLAGDKGFGIQSADGKVGVKIGALIQADARVFQDGIKGQHAYSGDSAAQQLNDDINTRSATDTFVTRRVRPIFDFNFGQYSARITPEFGGGSTSLIDAYIDANYDPRFRVRVGKFTPPAGLERLQSAAVVKFNELALPSNFLPSRDTGVQLYGALFDKRFEYTLGYFNGSNDGGSIDGDSNTDKEIAGRVFAKPFINEPGLLQGLGFGIGFTKGDAKGSTGSTLLAGYRTPGQETFFNYRGDSGASNTVIADGDRIRLVPQLSYYNGAFALTSEYAQVRQDLTRVFGAALGQQRSESVKHDAWHVTGSYLLTGEENTGGKVKPNRAFDWGKSGWGAWEVVARVGELNVDGKTFTDSLGTLAGTDSFAQATRSAKSARNYGVGLNWHPNSVIRVSLDYEQTSFDWGGGGTALNPKDRDDERVLLGRIQASF